jgi:hypothetical protein
LNTLLLPAAVVVLEVTALLKAVEVEVADTLQVSLVSDL